MTDSDITRLQLLATDPAVAYFIDTVAGRLQAGIVDRETYVAETRTAIERKRDAIAEALLAGELQEDQARHSTRVAEAQLTALELIDRDIDEATKPAAYTTELYRDDDGHEVWRIRDAAGETVQEGIASDHDLESIVAELTEELVKRLEAGELIASKNMSDREFLAPLLEEREHRFEVKVGLTGDSAEADTLEAALVAADTLVRDAFDDTPTQGRTRAARESITITDNGQHAGLATELARQGHRLPMSTEGN